MRQRLRRLFGKVTGWQRIAAQARRFVPQPGNVIAAPEYLRPEFGRFRPDSRKILAVQVISGMAHARVRCGSLAPLASYDAIIATSDACADFAREAAGVEPLRIKFNVTSDALGETHSSCPSRSRIWPASGGGDARELHRCRLYGCWR